MMRFLLLGFLIFVIFLVDDHYPVFVFGNREHFREKIAAALISAVFRKIYVGKCLALFLGAGKFYVLDKCVLLIIYTAYVFKNPKLLS